MLIHLRKDLLFYQRKGKSSIQWVVKDPVGFNHFLFSEEEFFLLKLFDGARSLEQIRTAWQIEFQTRALSKVQLTKLAQRFLSDNLLVADRLGDGDRLRSARQKSDTRQFWASLTAPYIFRFGRVNPRIVLDALELPAKILFHPVVILANLIFACLVLAFFVGHFESISKNASLMTNFFTVENMVIMTLVVGGVKILHELGHALACREFGGDCFEIGLLFIALFPTLYCDVSDSWTFKEKWKRILVSFAGIYVETILATLGALFWLTTNPGLANTICFNIAIMCSVNTLLINGNPLLKYDGYYVISDFFEQPNLASQSRQQLQHLIKSALSKSPQPVAFNAWLSLYGVLSWLYRMFVVVAILLGISLMMKALEFGRLGSLIIMGLVILMLLRGLRSRLIQGKSGLRYSFHRLRTTLASGLLLLIISAFFLLKLPSFVFCQFAVEPTFSSVVYSPRDGTLELTVDSYAYVAQGQSIGEIDDGHLNEQLSQATKELTNLRKRLKLAVKLQTESPQAAIDVGHLKNQIEKRQAQIATLEVEASNLVLKAEQAGFVRPFPIKDSSSDSSSVKLTNTNSTFFGNVFDEQNRNIPVRRGQPLLAISGFETSLIAYLNEDSVEQLEVGQNAILKFERTPSETFEGTVVDIFEAESLTQTTSSNTLPEDGLTGQSGQRTPSLSRYRVVIASSDIPPEIVVGSSGGARISTPPRTAFEKLWLISEQWWK